MLLTLTSKQFGRRRPSLWSLGIFVIAIPIALPIGAILWSLAAPNTEVWVHLRDTVLAEYALNTLGLLAIVALVAGSIGVATAWLTATCEFPGRGWFAWMLLLPFAAPAYVIAYAYADFLDYAGPLQTWLRESGVLDSALPSIRSLPGAGLVLGLVLFPYVYLFCYTAFADQARPLIEAARALGASPTRGFFQISLPMARPAIAGGLALALMETAADFGVADFYGVTTLTTGVFRTWYAQGEQQAAMQLAGYLFLLVAVLVVLEQFARRGRQSNPVSRNVPPPRTRLTGLAAMTAMLACAAPLALGFVLPIAILAHLTWTVGDPQWGASFFQYFANSATVAGIAAVLAVGFALYLAYALRLSGGTGAPLGVRIGVRTATLGYALPGMVLAVGAIAPLTAVDKWVAYRIQEWFDERAGLLLTGSVAALTFVYLARFLTVAYNNVESGLTRIPPQYDGAARSLGATPWRVLRQVHLPILLPTLFTALLLVFIDVIKELPATLILRPFNFETLATRAYRLASDERLAEASTAAIAIVALGLIPTLLLAWQTFSGRRQAD